MEKTNVSEVLRALATGDKNRSETARLTDIFDEVQAAIDAGVSRSAILDALHGQGFTMTLKAFESALYRIRKRRAKAAGGRSETVGAPAVAPAVESPSVPTTDQNPPEIPESGDISAVREALGSESRKAKFSQYGSKSLLKKKES
ncbi:TPA: hypothetical protein QDA71_005501 [Burkholderia vietnamiensis]|uniref:hypothetical protein n=1 Tax=Burkholderia vietnamiensis TaxID=60552 RepID=UPI001589EBDC|nr:hypothetical protein [Burkholderia vietnamiensis]HDR8948435.1 hypothetical protein [Burkholderia vietnamiensis]HDR9210678.1 hypothetical protein [Burkholderia vietnamiensis]